MSSAQPASFANDDNNIGIQAGQFIAHGPINVVQQTQDALGQLPRVADALFNSLAKQHQPICLENTRIELLNRIYNWAEGHDQRHIFWLCGLAGTGKSTIARTVARKYHNKQRLAGSFFFSRDSEDTKHARHFVTTIAAQLAGNVPALKPYVSNAVLKQRDIANQALQDQWHDLVHDPLSKLHDDGPITLILVIDALDECENREDILVIIQLLASAQSYPGVQLRLLLTSRPEMPIRNALSQLLVEHHSISPATDGHDVGLFLEDRFRHIAERSHQSIGWPGKDATELLRQSASGLFIWAETAWRYIYGGQKKALVQNRLQNILQNRSPASGPEAQLDRIYNTVLDSAVSILEEEDQDYFRSQLRYVLGTIVILLSPLSVLSLGELLESGDIAPKDDLDGILEDLHAILDIPTDRTLPLRLHHPSFREFLLHETRCHNDFRVEEKIADSHVWKSCIQLMSRSLQQNICKVKRHGILTSEVEDTKVEWYIPLELQYACRYWVQHLANSGDRLSDSDQVHSFLQEHFLHWLEVLGWIGKVAEGVHAIISLESMIIVSDCPELSAFIHDMKRFAQYNLLAIEQDPLQVYCSGLVFAPNRSIIKTQFRDKIPEWIAKLPHVNSNWGTLLQTLEGHTGEITVLAFSPNGKVLASGSDDCTIRLWDVETGAILQILQGRSGSVTAVAFTPYDSKILASASNNGTVRLWNTSTGELLQTLSVLSEYVKILTFSPDHKVLALVPEGRTVELWDWETNMRLQVRSYGADWVSAVVFSRDGRALALVSDFGRVRLMDIWKNVDVYAAVGSSHEVHQMAAISSHGEVIASVSTDESLTLWNADTDTITKIPRDDAGKVSEVALSPNGGLLASLSPDRTIKLWEADTGKLVQTVDEFSICEGPSVFSPTNKVLGYTSANTVKLWKADTGTVVHMLEGHSSSVTTMAFFAEQQRASVGIR